MLSTLRYYSDYLFAVIGYFYGRAFRSTMNTLTPIESRLRLSPLVYRVLGANPGPFTLRGTNTYLVGTGKSRVLIDTGEPNVQQYIDDLREALDGCEISCIICTHWHEDHVGGIKDVINKVIGKPVPVYKFKRTDAPEDSSKYHYVEDGYVIKTEGATLRLLSTPGHTMEHMAVYLEEENTIFSGDCILGEGTTIFEDLYIYMQSLHKLLEMKPSRIYPGHGPVVENPLEKIKEYISHRNQREQQILDVLHSSKTASSVKLAALSNVNHHISKLLKENKIEKIGIDNYRLITAAE
ncbi:Beta-lactamase-like protein 2 -like protein [Toxocara canis]|uniref:Beta-lactamase-like protein 2 homolog n=1 Tax=Toxocara canis TaxID=6265 RepID=A0A0B2VAI9_TOXCA|nr:Beta-lactamase-like protein 2 -like protein [Toxocara canis]